MGVHSTRPTLGFSCVVYQMYRNITVPTTVLHGCRKQLNQFIHPEFVCFAAPELDNETDKKLIYNKRK